MSHQTNIVALGDSVTVGAGFSGVTDDTTWTTILSRRIQQSSVSVETFLTQSALDGVDTAYAIKRFDRMVTRLQPDFVTIMLGLNDAKPIGLRRPLSPNEYWENLSHLIELSLAIDVRPVLASPNPRTDIYRRCGGIEDMMEAYAEAAIDVGAEYQIGCVNIYDRFVHNGHFDALIPDGLHPSPAGQMLIAEAFAETIIPLLGGTVDSVTVTDLYDVRV